MCWKIGIFFSIFKGHTTCGPSIIENYVSDTFLSPNSVDLNGKWIKLLFPFCLFVGNVNNISVKIPDLNENKYTLCQTPIIYINVWNQVHSLYKLFEILLTTFWQLFNKFSTTFWQLCENFLTTFQQLFDKISTTFQQLFNNFLTTFWQLFDNFLTPF